MTELRRIAVAAAAAIGFHGAIFGLVELYGGREVHEPRPRDALTVTVALQRGPADHGEINGASIDTDPPEKTRDVAPPNAEQPDTLQNDATARVADAPPSPMLPGADIVQPQVAPPDFDPLGATTPDTTSPEETRPPAHDRPATRASDLGSQTASHVAARESLETAGTAPSPNPQTAAAANAGTPTPSPHTHQQVAAAPTLDYRFFVPPEYPEEARVAGLSGSVRLRLSIDRRGRVQEVAVETSSAVAALDREAVRAAHLWRFPRGRDNRVSIHTVRFDLEDTE